MERLDEMCETDSTRKIDFFQSLILRLLHQFDLTKIWNSKIHISNKKKDVVSGSFRSSQTPQIELKALWKK